MIDPLEFLTAAHQLAEQTAQALRDELSWSLETERIEVYDDTFRRMAAVADPAAVLRRIAKERELLAEHQPEREVYIYPDVDEPGVLTRGCKTCAQGQQYDIRPEPYPCPTVRLLAEAWGWTAEER